jgi:hypothetical protein
MAERRDAADGEASHAAHIVGVGPLKRLAEMARDGLPQDPEKALEIEVPNADHFPIVRLLLELKVDYLAAPAVKTTS